jgi:hypothetical protein
VQIDRASTIGKSHNQQNLHTKKSASKNRVKKSASKSRLVTPTNASKQLVNQNNWHIGASKFAAKPRENATQNKNSTQRGESPCIVDGGGRSFGTPKTLDQALKLRN